VALHQEAPAPGFRLLNSFNDGAGKLKHRAAAQAGHVVVVGLARRDFEAPARSRGGLALGDA
jgi:hypothetical protein